MAIQQKVFKISDLHDIKHIDGKDIFLVSDYENGKYYTKKMSADSLMSYIGSNNTVATAIADNRNVQNKIDMRIETAAETGVLAPAISNEVDIQISAQTEDKGSALNIAITNNVENALSTALSAIDGGSAFDF